MHRGQSEARLGRGKLHGLYGRESGRPGEN